MILDDAQIEARMQERINSVWPPTRREKALRLGGALLDELNAFFTAMSVEKQAMVAERDVAQAELDAVLAAEAEAAPEEQGPVE